MLLFSSRSFEALRVDCTVSAFYWSLVFKDLCKPPFDRTLPCQDDSWSLLLQPPQTRKQGPWGHRFCFILFNIMSPVPGVNDLKLSMGITFVSVPKHCMVSSFSSSQEMHVKDSVSNYFLVWVQRYKDDVTNSSTNPRASKRHSDQVPRNNSNIL